MTETCQKGSWSEDESIDESLTSQEEFSADIFDTAYDKPLMCSHCMKDIMNRSKNGNPNSANTKESYVGVTRKSSALSYSTFNLPDMFDGSDVGNCLGIDFGGTLTKIVFFQPDTLPETARAIAEYVSSTSKYGTTGERDLHMSFKSKKLGGTFHFIRFRSSRTLGALELFQSVQTNSPSLHITQVHGTGGGAHKYKGLIEKQIGIKVNVHDEFKTVVAGLVFTLLEHPDTECYTYVDYHEILSKEESTSFSEDDSDVSPRKMRRRIRQRSGSTDLDVLKVNYSIASGSRFGKRSKLFPFIIVNIGSGVSMLKVESPTKFERVSGTALGGATYLALCNLLCQVDDFEHALKLAENGDDRKVNLLVNDIYGGALVSKTLSEKSPLKKMSSISLSDTEDSSKFEQRGLNRRAQTMPGFENLRRSSKEADDNGVFTLKADHTAAFFGKLLHGNFKMKDNSSTSSGTEYGLAGIQLGELLLWFSLSIICCLFSMTIGLKLEKSSLDYLFSLSLLALPVVLIIGLSTLKQWQGSSSEATKNGNPLIEVKPEDVAKALVIMISQNITQIAYMNAKMHNLTRVVFTGNFLRHNDIAQITLAKNIKIWSKGEILALFMEHEGYFGAMGSFLAASENAVKTKSDVDVDSVQ